MIEEVRGWLVKVLESWSLTFDETDDEDEKEEGLDLDTIVLSLKEKTSAKFTQEALEEVLFHLWQIFYNLDHNSPQVNCPLCGQYTYPEANGTENEDPYRRICNGCGKIWEIRDAQPWEVQEYTVIDGWINTWHDGNEYSLRFSTEEEAQMELTNYLRDMNRAYKKGDIAAPYNRENFKIVNIYGDKQ